MWDQVVKDIKRQEAYKSHAYRDTKNVLTIGYGLNLDDGISEALASKIVEWIVEERASALGKTLSFWGLLSQARKEVFVNMAYNLGIPKFLKFRDMLSAASRGDVDAVCLEMKDSKWYYDVGNRAKELIEKYRRG